MIADEARKKEKQEVQREDKWRRLIMVALFLDDNKTNDDGDGKENSKLILNINKQQLCTCTTLNFARAPRSTLHVHHAILYISLPSLHHYDMKLPNFTSPLYGVGEHNTKIVAFFF